MSQTCIDCLAVNVSTNPDFARNVGFCSQPTDLEQLFYGGSHGVMLASKTPMQNKQLIDYTDKWIVSRSTLYAETEGVQIGCTHLSTRIPLPYTGEHTDIVGQQRYELNTLLNHMNDQENGQPQIMLGDFNTGPDAPRVDAEFGVNYELIPE